MGRLVGELRDVLIDFVGRKGGVFLDWIANALGKVAELSFKELTPDQAVFLIACVAIVVLGLIKLAALARTKKSAV